MKLLVRRIIGLIPVILAVSVIVAALIELVPGDPVDIIAGDFATEAQKQNLRHQLGLDQAFHVRVTSYIANLFQGDLGQSLIYGKPVIELIVERMGATFELALAAILFALIVSIPLGVLSAIRSKQIIDYGSTFFALLGVSLPNFWLGPLLILLFSLHLGWLPVSGQHGISSFVLPVLTLGTALLGITTRMTRTSFLENLQEDYVRTAFAKGLTPKKVHFKHVLANAILPVVTIVGLQFGVLLTGSVITEKIFDWPGLGSLIIEAIGNRDFPVVQGCVLFFAFVYILVNLVTDLVYRWIDPRIRMSA